MNAVAAFEGVRFTYPTGTLALDGVDLELMTGTRTAIVGQNGSGKSTLVRHLNGLLRPSAGRVTVGGGDAASRHVAELARTVGLVFQDPDRQVFARSVAEEVAFGPRNLGFGGAGLAAAVDEALEAVGLAAVREQNPYDLGRSRRKLLSIASVLAMQTPVVVLDEPTTGQDARGIERIGRLVRELDASGRTVIAISHDMRFVTETFERVVVMRDGRVVLDGTPAEVFAESNWATLASTYLEPPLPARLGAAWRLGATPTDDALLDALEAGAS